MDNKEIDRLIAEKVMNYRVIPPSVHEPTGFKNDGYFVVKEESDNEDAIWISPWEYSPSTNVQDAFKVWKKLNDEDCYIQVEQESDFNFVVYIYDGYYEETITKSSYGESETFPMAICQAALRLFEIEIN